MITVPTGDFVGILSDTIPFAFPDDDLPTLNCIRLEWDGDMLHALATDRYRVGWSQWHPDDEPDGEAQDDMFTRWGSGDDPWSFLLPLADAKELVKVFKLPAKEQRVPLTVDVDGGQLKVARSRDTGYSAHTTVLRGAGVDIADVPNVRQMLADNDRVQAVTGLAYSAKWLADFAKVRPRGPMELTFTGTTQLTHVTIGERFVGAIIPSRVGADGQREPAKAAA